MSIVFLFGAGASAYSGQCHPAAPPDGRHLFRELQKYGKVAATVSEALAAEFDADFEAGIERFFRERGNETVTFLREMACYLGQFSPGDGNHYTSLVRAVTASGESAVFATLNYDILLEVAMSRLGFSVAYTLNPTSARHLHVLKLHGSCNFLPELGDSSISGLDIDLATVGSVFEGPVKAVGYAGIKKFCREQDSLAPVLALYAKGKQVPVCPEMVKRQQEFWRDAVANARRICIIGVRLTPEDEHVWHPIEESNAAIDYVGPDAEPVLQWARDHRKANVQHLARSFGDVLPKLTELFQ